MLISPPRSSSCRVGVGFFLGGGDCNGSSSLHTRFFRMTFERYKSLALRMGGLGGYPDGSSSLKHDDDDDDEDEAHDDEEEEEEKNDDDDDDDG